jgi:hypothetical protein
MIIMFSRAFACAALVLAAIVPATIVPAAAQDDVQTFNAFAVVAANGTIVRSAEKRLMVIATLAGPLFVETDEGPQQGGRVSCAIAGRIDQGTRETSASGACTFTAHDGATAWGDWECAGYELVGCRGAFKLTGGTGRFVGASGESALVWRPTTHELEKQLDGGVLDDVTGIVLWRDFKLKGK